MLNISQNVCADKIRIENVRTIHFNQIKSKFDSFVNHKIFLGIRCCLHFKHFASIYFQLKNFSCPDFFDCA